MKFGILFLVLVPSTNPAEQKEPKFASLRLNLPITSAKDLVKMGNKYVDRQEYDRALEFFNKAINMRNPDPSHYCYRAKCYLKKGDPTHALSDFKSALGSANYKIGKCTFVGGDFAELGKMLFQEARYDNAFWCFSEALKMKYNHGPYLVFRGKCHLRMDNFDEAISDFLKAAGELEDLSEIFTLLREALLRKSGKFYENTRDDPRATNSELLKYGDSLFEDYEFSEALQFYNEAITEESPASYHDRRAICYTRTGNLDAALLGFKRRAAEYERTSILDDMEFSSLGRELFKNNDRINEAIWCISEAIKLNPKSREHYYYRSIFYNKKGDFKAAVSDFRKARELGESLHTQDVGVLTNLADQLLIDGLFDDAVWCFSELIKMDRSEGLYHFLRGKCYLQMEKYDSAISDLTEAVRLIENPADIFPHLRKAFLLKSGKFDDTTKDDPTASDHDILEHANALVDLAKCDVALMFYEEALKEDSPTSYYDHRAICYIWAGKLDAALSYVKNAVESEKRTDDLGDTIFGDLGEMLLSQGNKDDAYWCISKAISLAPSNWKHLQTRAKYHFQVGHFDSAMSDLREAFFLLDDKLQWQNKYEYATLLRDCVRQCGRFDDDIKEIVKLLLNYYHLERLGYYLLEDGKAEEALFCYDEAIKLNPDEEDAFCGRGQCYAYMKQYDKAISNLKEGISKTKIFDKGHWYSLIDASLSLGKFDDLQNEIRRLKEKHFEDLAQMFLKHNEFEKGIRVCDAGIKRYPDTSRLQIFEVRSQCHKKMGNTEMAKLDLEKIEKLKDSFFLRKYYISGKYGKSDYDVDGNDLEEYVRNDSYYLWPIRG